MTGGQMAPTTLCDQVTTTSPRGRDVSTSGHPIRMVELLESLPGVKYLERVKVTDPSSIIKTKRAIKKAFQNQIDGIGFSMVEVLTSCPENWKMDPVKSLERIDTVVSQYYELKKIKDVR